VGGLAVHGQSGPPGAALEYQRKRPFRALVDLGFLHFPVAELLNKGCKPGLNLRQYVLIIQNWRGLPFKERTNKLLAILPAHAGLDYRGLACLGDFLDARHSSSRANIGKDAGHEKRQSEKQGESAICVNLANPPFQ
jgi:hypothetical protein